MKHVMKGLVLSLLLCLGVGAFASDKDARRRYLAAVDWEAASAHPPLVGLELNRAQRQTLSLADVPVLVPESLYNAAEATAIVGEGWYAFTLNLPEHTVAVFGTRVVFREPGLTFYLEAPGGPEASFITRMDGCPLATFNAFEVSYSVQVICNILPFEDPRCVDDAYVEELTRSMARVSPGGAK